MERQKGRAGTRVLQCRIMNPFRHPRSQELNAVLVVEIEAPGTFKRACWKEHGTAIRPSSIDGRLNGSGVVQRRGIGAISTNVDPGIRPFDGDISLHSEMSIDKVAPARGSAIRVRRLSLARHESRYSHSNRARGSELFQEVAMGEIGVWGCLFGT